MNNQSLKKYYKMNVSVTAKDLISREEAKEVNFEKSHSSFSGKITQFLIGLIFVFSFMSMVQSQESKRLPIPTQQQLLWHDMEITMFVCMDPCTWQGKEYDDHSTSLKRVNPEKLAVYMVGDEKEYNKLNSKTDGFGNVWGIGESKKYKDTRDLGVLSHYLEKEKYTIDLAEYIDKPGQYELFVAENMDAASLRLFDASIWFEGVETPGFCKINKIYNRLELNITAIPTMTKGSIVIKFKIEDRVEKQNVYLRKVVFN